MPSSSNSGVGPIILPVAPTIPQPSPSDLTNPIFQAAADAVNFVLGPIEKAFAGFVLNASFTLLGLVIIGAGLYGMSKK